MEAREARMEVRKAMEAVFPGQEGIMQVITKGKQTRPQPKSEAKWNAAMDKATPANQIRLSDQTADKSCTSRCPTTVLESKYIGPYNTLVNHEVCDLCRHVCDRVEVLPV